MEAGSATAIAEGCPHFGIGIERIPGYGYAVFCEDCGLKAKGVGSARNARREFEIKAGGEEAYAYDACGVWDGA